MGGIFLPGGVARRFASEVGFVPVRGGREGGREGGEGGVRIVGGGLGSWSECGRSGRSKRHFLSIHTIRTRTHELLNTHAPTTPSLCVYLLRGAQVSLAAKEVNIDAVVPQPKAGLDKGCTAERQDQQLQRHHHRAVSSSSYGGGGGGHGRRRS